MKISLKYLTSTFIGAKSHFPFVGELSMYKDLVDICLADIKSNSNQNIMLADQLVIIVI